MLNDWLFLLCLFESPVVWGCGFRFYSITGRAGVDGDEVVLAVVRYGKLLDGVSTAQLECYSIICEAFLFLFPLG